MRTKPHSNRYGPCFSDLGWSDTGNATGAKQGELGGTFGRVADEVSFYNLVADPFNDPWTLDTPLRFRAKAWFENINFNWGMGLGFANINDVTGERIDNLGIWVLEPSGVPEFRTGTEIFSSEDPGTIDNCAADARSGGLRGLRQASALRSPLLHEYLSSWTAPLRGADSRSKFL